MSGTGEITADGSSDTNMPSNPGSGDTTMSSSFHPDRESTSESPATVPMSWTPTNPPDPSPISTHGIGGHSPSSTHGSGGDQADDEDSATSDGAEGEDPLEVFKSILSTATYTQNILEADQDFLTGGEKRTLQRIARHFDPPRASAGKRKREDGEEGEAAAAAGGGGGEGERPARRPASTSAWAAILRLTSLALPPAIRRHLAQDPRGRPELFLNDPRYLNNLEGQLQGKQANQGEGFLCSIRYCKQVESRSELDRARRLFSMLFFYDFITTRYPGTRGRVGPIMEREIKAYFNRMNPPDLHVGETLEDLRKYSLRGRKLSRLAEQFGTGVMFVLANELSSDFLDSKCPLSGVAHDQAIDHLRDLGMRGFARESRANKLGDNVRQQLLRQWSLPEGRETEE